MTNWTDIHPDFAKREWLYYGETYQELWEQKSLTYQEAQQWIQVGFKPSDHWSVEQWKDYGFTFEEAQKWLKMGLNKESVRFAKFLLDKEYTSVSFPSNSKLNELKEEYLANTNDWSVIHEDFARTIDFINQRAWEEEGLTCQDAQEWIGAGFKVDDYSWVKSWKNINLTLYLKQNNRQPEQINNLEDLRKEFKGWIENAQNYLDFY